jgi:AcrR family transcriptional regulator
MEDKDFSQVTTRELAAQAGIAEATLFRYFARKDEILISLVEDEGQDFFSKLDPILAVISSPRERLLAMHRHHALFAFERRDLVWTLERELTYLRPTSDHLKVLLRQFLKDLGVQIQAGIELGEFRSDLCVSSAALSFHGIIRLLLMEECLLAQPHPTSKSFLKRADELVKILLTGLEEPKK